MKKINWAIIVLVAILQFSCGGGKVEVDDSYDRDKFISINYEEILGQKSRVNLSDIAGSIEYIRFETNENCLFTMKPDFFFTDSYIFVNNSKHILQFDRKGNFIKQIGKYGRGPGEIGLIRQLTVLDDEKMLIVQTNWARKLYDFNYEGELLRQRKVHDIHKIIALPDNRLLYYDMCVLGNEDYMFVLTNSQGDTLSVVNNHYKWKNTSGFIPSVSYDLFKPFYNYNGATYFKSRHNDTIYKTIGDIITPSYYVDLGSYLLPQENRIEALSSSISARMQDYKEASSGYRFISTLEADEKIFISSMDYKSFWDDEVQYNMLFYRKGARGNLLVDDSGNPSGLINDLDGGPEFWPTGSVNDSTVYMLIPAHDFTNLVSLNDIPEENRPKSEQFSNLKDMINDITEDDNAILMVVHLK
jgi:hypothetical protein